MVNYKDYRLLILYNTISIDSCLLSSTDIKASLIEKYYGENNLGRTLLDLLKYNDLFRSDIRNHAWQGDIMM
jgi:hypothetical protein